MAIKGVFVGVNKHADQEIPELTGATKDARALWALFSDTIGGFSGRLLLDENANLNDTRAAIIATLESANPDDVIIISFSGHGSPDGRLAVYDTVKANLTDTSIGMDEISAVFRTTQAKVVLFILDCCFSGNAPAKVLEIDAQPRAAFVLNEIFGEGRILLAACKETEAAWEQTGTGHGLLTYAFIQSLAGESGQVKSFPGVIDEIIAHARTEATRLGVTQTPVFLGTVTGGLTFPALQKGPNYQASFPVIPTRVYSGAFTELIDNGVPQAIIDQWVSRFPTGLNALQLAAVNDHAVLSGGSLMVIAPTSSGKTMIGELASVQSVLQGKKAAFLLPYRALVSEKFEEFTARYAESGIRVARCAGDAADGVGAVLQGRYDIGFFTYEMFLNLALTSPRLLPQLGTLVLDEAQFITDPSRGITVELILSLLRRARTEDISPQLIVLSAVIGRLNNFDTWLDLNVLRSDQRPVPLVEGVIDRTGTFQFVDTDGSTKQESLISAHSIAQRRSQQSAQDVIVPLVRKLVDDGEKVIVFRNIRGSAQGCANYLAQELGLPPATTVLERLPEHDLTRTSADLRGCLEGGTAFHSTNLLREEREVIERGFRDVTAGIHVLASTTTLAAGINTPASTVILAENEFIGEDVLGSRWALNPAG